MSLPLDPYTVIDLTRARSGPTCVRQLADMGAHVIQISAREDTEGDFVRRGFDSQNLHRNKRSLTLDLKSPAGIDIIKRLVAKADVVVENFRPDVKHRLGIDYETLSKLNPRLIYASISGFGQTGPYRDRPGYDQIAQGTGGLMSVTGLPGQGPVRVGIPIADLTAGIFLAQGVLGALIERERSGKGQWVHTSLLEAMVTMLDFQAARWLIDGTIPPQAGNDHPTGIQDFRRPHQYRCLRPAYVPPALRGFRHGAAAGRPALQDGARPLEEPEGLERRAREGHGAQDERRVGGALERQGRAVASQAVKSAKLTGLPSFILSPLGVWAYPLAGTITIKAITASTIHRRMLVLPFPEWTRCDQGRPRGADGVTPV